MQYQVPQFIEVEDKIFGPLTFKQFAYIVGGAGMCFLAYRFLPFFIAIVIILPVASFSVALAFYKVNNRPFIQIVEAGIRYILGKKLYLWKKDSALKAKREEEKIPVSPQKISVPKLSESKLRELTWSLDINETIYSKDDGLKNAEVMRKKPVSDELSAFRGLSTDLNRQK